MKKSLLIIFACILCVVGFQAFTVSHHPTYRNLKILPQDISKDGLDSVMHLFTASLGVKCNFCHQRNEAERTMDFASDAKPEKNIARKMLLMTIMLNKSYFKMDMMDMDMGMDHDHDMNDSSHNAEMAKMMMHEKIDTTLNSDDYKVIFNTVTCFTCHRGDPHPDSKLPMQPPPQFKGQPGQQQPNPNNGGK